MTEPMERIPREQDPEALARKMDWTACRLDSPDDTWHVLAMVACTQHWRGVRIIKNQFDMRRYFDILTEYRPEVIVETGLQQGGSALFFMDAAEAAGCEALYIGIDLDCRSLDPCVRDFPRPHMIIRRDALAPETVQTVRDAIAKYAPAGRVLIVLDSVHSEEHVAAELALYAPLVPPGGYLVIEDTDHGGRPILANYGPSAAEAVEAFMFSPAGRVFHRARWFEERYGAFTNCPNGWLRRVG